MNREEAIEILSHPVKLGHGLIIENENTKLVGNAIDMAIISLKQEPKAGHWIRFKEFENGYYHIKCSECGQYWSIDGHVKIFKYCFNCGAKMAESEE